LADVLREKNISQATFYAWRSKYGDMEASDARKLKDLEDENRRLKQLVADQALDIQALKLVKKNGESRGPAQGRAPAAERIEPQRALGLPDHQDAHPHRYKAKKQDAALTECIKAIVAERPRFGYKRIHNLLHREGLAVNHKRVYRLYRQENLAVRRRKHRRYTTMSRVMPGAPTWPNERWSMDFASDSLADGRSFRVFNVVDDFTRECLASVVDLSLPGGRVARELGSIVIKRGAPRALLCDNGPELTSKALDQWAYEQGIAIDFIKPGKPTQNAYAESFNGRMRDECLNQHWFHSLSEAKRLIAAWRHDYNQMRPHCSLSERTPTEFARVCIPLAPTISCLA
jgi:putative transposase